MSNGAGQEDAPPPSEQLLANVLDFHLQAATSPSEADRKWQRRLGLLCICGALFVAIWLVIEGPPTPKTSEPESPDAAKVTGVGVAFAAAATPGETPADPGEGSESTPGQSSEGSEPNQPAPSEPGEDGGESEEETDTTSSLSGEAPWVFAIVALLVGAFLAAGQSIGFGSGATPPQPDDQGGAPAPGGNADAGGTNPPTPDPAAPKP